MSAFQRHNRTAAKLTGEQVVEIRERYAFERVTQAQLSREYGVSLNTIANIVNGLSWQGVGMQVEHRAKGAGVKYAADAEASAERIRARIAAMSLYDDPPPTQDEDSRAGRGLEKLNKLLDEKAEVGRQLDDLTK
jgi:hypothetical protein